MGFILDFASAGMAKARDFWATQVSIEVGFSRALNPRPDRMRAKPAAIATITVNRMPPRNQRTIYYTSSERKLQRELHQPRRSCFHHLTKETAIEVAVYR